MKLFFKRHWKNASSPSQWNVNSVKHKKWVIPWNYSGRGLKSRRTSSQHCSYLSTQRGCDEQDYFTHCWIFSHLSDRAVQLCSISKKSLQAEAVFCCPQSQTAETHHHINTVKPVSAEGSQLFLKIFVFHFLGKYLPEVCITAEIV